MSNRIAFLCHPYHRGGVTSWMISAACEAQRVGMEVYFITVDPVKPFISGGNRPSMVSVLSAQTIKPTLIAPKVDYEFELGTEEYRSDVYQSAILKSVPEHTPIIISDGEAVWMAASALADRYPMIGVLHSDDPVYYQLAYTYRLRVSRFVAVSGRIVNTLKQKGFPDAEQIQVIPCGIDLSGFYNQNQFASAAELRILWVGRVEEYQKRVSDIPLIAKQIKQQNVNFSIQVIGHGTETAWLKQEIEKESLSDVIVMKGWQNLTQLAEHYSQADILLQTSNFEGMSVAVMEALASGCAVVSSRVSGIEDYENDARVAHCVSIYEIGNITEAVNAINKVRQTDARARKQEAINFATSEFSISICMQRYVGLLKESGVIPGKLRKANSLLVKFKSHTLSLIRKVKYEVLLVIKNNH